MLGNKQISYAMRHKVGHSIKQAIIESGYSDIELAEELGLTRTSVYLWRKRDDSVIRKSNLVSLAKLLDKEISYNNDIVEFSDIEIQDNLELNESINLESDMMTLNAEDIIKDLRSDKQDLRETIISLKEENKALHTTIESMNRNLESLNKRINQKSINMNLDHNRLQFVVNMQKATYISCTQLYADLYNKDAFDIMNHCSWDDLVHEDDTWRFPIIMVRESDEMRLNPQTWKVKGKNGKSAYVETISTPLDDEGIFKKVDAKISTKEKWAKSNEYYKSFPEIKD
jgi:transcriptional regulator with XRE-family HTH domain